jgi:alpha-beta hydrolase superfamily lysophospholipase
MIRPTLTTADGVTLAGRRWLRDTIPAATVVIVHGFTASSEEANVEALAESLYADGFDVITYDARGHGASDGESTLGDDEQHDVAAAVSLARERTETVVVVGASMGAIASLRYAVADHHLAGVVAVSCPADWRLPLNIRTLLAVAMTRTRVGRRITTRLCGVRVAQRWANPRSPLQLAPELRVPVTYVHGTDDRFIPMRSAAQLYEATAAPRRIDIVRRMGHAFEPLAIAPVRDAISWALSYRLSVAS